MSRRWVFAGALVAIAGLAVGLAFELRSPGPGVWRPLGASTSVAKLRVSTPRGFHNYPLPRDVYAAWAIGHVLTNFRVPTDTTIDSVLRRWSNAQWKFAAVKNHNYGPPSTAVALELAPSPGPRFPDAGLIRLHLPLSPDQRWFQARLASGAPFYRYGLLRFHHRLYEVLYWIGPDAPANDRAAVLRALRSIRPTR